MPQHTSLTTTSRCIGRGDYKRNQSVQYRIRDQLNQLRSLATDDPSKLLAAANGVVIWFFHKSIIITGSHAHH